MPLALESRRVGDITVVKCSGRIVEGTESAALQQQLNALFPREPYIVLHLSEVQFIDSSSLGLLTRLLARARNANGSLKLCAVSPKIDEVLRVTKLRTVFDSYESEAAAIASFYERAKAPDAPYRFDTDILCVETSADVLAYVRELLGQAGYGVMTAGNLPDALTLLRATQPKLVVIGADLRSSRATESAERFNRLVDALPVVKLPADFSRHEAGEAGQQLLDQVRTTMNAGGTPFQVQ